MDIQLVLQMMLVLLFRQETFALDSPTAKPGCQQTCGSLKVSYPFGIGANCAAAQSFVISCNNSFNPPKAFFSNNTLEVLEISLDEGTIKINYPVIKDCINRSKGQEVILSSPFTFSDTKNRFTAMGCDNLALIFRQGLNIGGCLSFCDVTSGDNSCLGIKCCQTQIPPSLNFINASLSNVGLGNDRERCRYAFIVDQIWFGNLTDIYSVTTMEQVPAVLEWRLTGSCQSFGVVTPSKNSSACGSNAFCTDQGLCSCYKGYDGNPYMPGGCQDIDECGSGTNINNYGICVNTPGSYDRGVVDKVGEVHTYTKKVPIVLLIASFSGLGAVLFLTGMWVYKLMKRRKLRKLKENCFRRNGGLLLHQQVSYSEGNVETTKLFTSNELEKATDHYHVDRILGQGGQGTVYKGMLTDGKIVAVKKSKIEDERQIKHFINEVVILSQINHRNVVKLHGCCLETEVPLLVYEFIPNGTLFQYIHDQHEDFPLTWNMRVRVATEVAGALSYLHSAASLPVYHRDIKSTNILLDDRYRAKVADFGTSRSISIDQTNLITKVQGTFGYFDPEYFQSSQYTDKSDVYSFGVVLVELLTGKTPILPATSDNEDRSLVNHFILAMEENRILDILDSRIMNEGGKEDIITFAHLAHRCLNLYGRKRPTMNQVSAELNSIRMSHGLNTTNR